MSSDYKLRIQIIFMHFITCTLEIWCRYLNV